MATEEKKKNPLQRRMSSNGVPGSDEDPKKRPRLSIYWVYGIIFAAIIAYNLYRGNSSSGVEMSNTDYYEMLKKGDVDQIKTVGNKKIVRVFIKSDALNSDQSFFSGVFKKSTISITSTLASSRPATSPKLMLTLAPLSNQMH